MCAKARQFSTTRRNSIWFIIIHKNSKKLKKHIILFFINFQVGFEFKRTQTAFYVQSFIPSGLLVFASFLSLWIPCSHIPGRMTLTITTTLSLMTLMNRYYSIMIFISDGLNIKRTQISFSISNKLEHIQFLILEHIPFFASKFNTNS